jgi:hypothetical protein
MNQKNGLIPVLCLIAAALSVAGCDRARSVIGLDKQAPDEFAVVTRAPLSLPPDYGLRPPTPGAQRPQEQAVRNEARDILLRNSRLTPSDAVKEAVSSGRFSTGEAAFLARAGALNADPTIRQTVNRESTAIAEATTGMLDKVLFWRKVDEPGVIVDPEKESRRLREARAMGDAVNKGEVPIIERKQRGILEGIF